MKHTLTLLTALLLAPLDALHAADAPKPTVKPNVLFIITDQQFGESMSCRMGEQHLRTPAMDSLARTGVVFTRAHAANPLCMPSRNAMFTGRYPHETGVTKNAGVKLDPAEFVNMGDYFRKGGYESAYFGKSHLCFKLGVSFDAADQSATKGHDVASTENAVRFLGEKHDRPFLLVVSLMNPHNICEYARAHHTQPPDLRGTRLPDGPIGIAPRPDQCPPAPANLAPQVNEPDTMTIMRNGYHASPMFPVGDFKADDWRQVRWAYYRLIEKVDAQIGEVLGALRIAGLEENTVIVFTSDHGECAGAHGFNQKTVLYEESVRVPLIVSCKGRTAVGLSDRLVNTGIDILPTMLDFAGIPVPPKLPGRSLRPLATGAPVATWRDHVVVQNNMDQAGSIGAFRPSAEGRMVRTVRYKYCVYSHGNRRESLVDLEKDPGETVNLAADPAYREELLRHRKLLADFAQEHSDPLAAQMLAEDVPPRPFFAETVSSESQRKSKNDGKEAGPNTAKKSGKGKGRDETK